MIPLWFVFWMILAFAWLFYESDWLRIRLPVGKITCKVPNPNELFVPFTYKDSWGTHTINPFQPDTKPVKIYRVSYDHKIGITRDESFATHQNPSYLDKTTTLAFSAGIDAPICGWEWLLNREHPPVNYEMTVTAFNCKHTIMLNPNAHNGKVIQQVSQAILKPNREERKYINKQRKESRR